jgi:hypothetical protein
MYIAASFCFKNSFKTSLNFDAFDVKNKYLENRWYPLGFVLAEILERMYCSPN